MRRLAESDPSPNDQASDAPDLSDTLIPLMTPHRRHRLALAAALLLPWVLSPEIPAEDRSHFSMGPVRVFYSVAGESAVPPEDLDGSGVPDRVEDVAKQVWAAREFFHGCFGFPDPFESKRFGEVDCVQVSLLAKSKINGLNGTAYRIPQRARAIPGGSNGDRALILAVANTVDPIRNPTPAHEYFHLIQYGATYFGNRWFLEGMARWSEAAWRSGGTATRSLARPMALPIADGEREKLFEASYDAAALFWNPLAAESADRRDGGAKRNAIPEALANLRYSDGSPVLKADALEGAALMGEVLVELDRADDVAARALKIAEWTLPLQGAEANNLYILETALSVARRRSTQAE